MKRVMVTVALISFFMGITFITSVVAAEHEAHHPGDTKLSAPALQGMMGNGMHDMMGNGMHGMMGSGKHGMMGNGMLGMMGNGTHGMMGSGMMEQRMAHMFFLDRAEELGLSTEQVGKLKKLHSECRKDNIRNAAEVKIARLELADLLDGDSWSLKDAEPLVRKVHNLEGDILVRHLQAISNARKELTAEQLKQARSEGNSGDPESLFQ